MAVKKIFKIVFMEETKRKLNIDKLLKWRDEFPILHKSTYLILNSLGQRLSVSTNSCTLAKLVSKLPKETFYKFLL